MSTPSSFPAYHDLAACDTTTAAQCRRLCGFETVYFGVGGPKDKFPVVLYALLEKAKKEDFTNIIGWQPHGRAFKIHDHVALETDILSKHLRRPIKHASFQRQLHLYGFLQLPFRGLDAGCYYHECFLRGRSDFCSLMQRTTKSSCHVRQSRDPSTAPNFASMLTTENAFVALQLSQTMNSPSSNNMMKPKPIVAQGNCHDSILLGNVNDAMEVAPHNPMMYNDASRIQSSLPDPQFLRGHLAENDRHSVASGVGNEEGGLLRVLSQTLDRSQQDFLCSLFTVAQRVSPSEELADMGDNNVQNEPLPWRTETAMPRETPAIPDCELHQSKSAALPGKTCDEIDAQERADTRSIDEVPAEEPTAWNVASPRATPAPIGETSAVLPAEELVAAEDDLTCTEHDESSKAKALVCVVDPVTKTNDNVDFSMTVKLQTVLAEIK